MVDMHGLEIPEPPEIPETPGEEYNQALRDWCNELGTFKQYFGELSPEQTAVYLCANVYGDAAKYAENYVLKSQAENAHLIHNLPEEEVMKLPPTLIPTTDDPYRLLQEPTVEKVQAVKEYITDHIGEYQTSFLEGVVGDAMEHIAEFFHSEPETPEGEENSADYASAQPSGPGGMGA